MKLGKGFYLIGKKLQEAAALSHSDLRSRISKNLSETYEDSGKYCWVIDVYGGEESGSVVYSCGDDTFQAPYAVTGDQVTVNTKKAFEVDGKMVWKKRVAMEEAHVDIEFDEPETEAKESSLRESASSFLEEIPLAEAGRQADYPIKLIQPGWGASGFYSKEVLERDGPKIFKAGTQMFWNHPTSVEEAARPEGDMNHLAAVTTADATYQEAGKEGPGLYARAKVFADYHEAVKEKAPHTGLSIRAYGKAKEGKAEGKTGTIIESLTRAESVDFVTKPGAGGKLLTESARDAETDVKEGATDMDAAEFKKLQESQARLEADNKKLRERMALSEAAGQARGILSGIRLADAVRDRVIERCVANVTFTESGELDLEKFKAALLNEAKEETAYISKVTGGAQVVGMGAPVTEAADPVAEAKSIREASIAEWIRMGHTKERAEILADGRAN